MDLFTAVINTKCNQRCSYCPPMGESYIDAMGEISIANLEDVFSNLHYLNIKHLRISGGEPLLHRDFDNILKILPDLRQRGMTVHLNTNGVYLDKYLNEKLLDSIDYLRISLDTLDENKYHKITGTNKLDVVIKNIRKAKKLNINITIIMVLMKLNFSELPDMIKFARTEKINLKLSDLEEHEFDSKNFIKEQRVEIPTSVIENITNSECKYIKGPSKYGIDMFDFTNGENIVRVKSTKNPKFYNNTCINECPAYPCPEGIYSYLLTPPCHISWCKRRKDIGINIHKKKKLTECLIKIKKTSIENIHKK